jgi:2-keto-4-pentenoate hydratase/2-oxohepta-3-ene-1,7-dioic acid hydratase in catechol pathway
MKLVTFTESNSTRVGLVVEGGIVDLSKTDASLPKDMVGLIAAWPKVKATVASAASRKADFALSAVTLQAPVPRPSKAMAIGLNYADHIE